MIEAPTLKPLLSPSDSRQASQPDDPILDKAKQFEAVFIAQMLKHSGFSKAIGQNSGFGGDAFADMLTQKYADEIANNGGFGLAKKIYEQLAGREAQNENSVD